jgi:hypothetical protein
MAASSADELGLGQDFDGAVVTFHVELRANECACLRQSTDVIARQDIDHPVGTHHGLRLGPRGV